MTKMPTSQDIASIFLLGIQRSENFIVEVVDSGDRFFLIEFIILSIEFIIPLAAFQFNPTQE